MGCWRVACLLLVVVRFAQPSCLLCQQQCQQLSHDAQLITNSTRVTISCDREEQNSLVSFINNNNFDNVQSLTLRSPQLLTLNLTKFYKVSNLNFSENNISLINLRRFPQLTYVNLSHNQLTKFVGVFLNLTRLDLSYNSITNLSQNIVLPKHLTHFYVNNNLIRSISNVSSNSLKYLDLSSNKIQKLEVGHCPSLKQLSLSSNLITEIQIKLYSVIPNVETLNISSNFLTKLTDYNFNLTNLLKLDLRNNKIYSLSQKCFSGLSRLQYLDISLNRIQTVSPSTFQYLSGLINLVVSENKELSSQDFGLLLATRRLKSVYATKTNQKKIPSSLTRSVRYLVLSFNNISQIQCGDLDSYPLLNSLNLANNNISYIEDDALGRLELLTTINLDNNFLSTIPHTLPNNLKYLFLQNNKIKNIYSSDFTGLQQLIQLDLSMNLIKELNDGSFSQIYLLEKLNVSGNEIKVLSSNSFSGLQKLKILDLSYLSNLTACNQSLCFPVPEYNHLQELYMKNSSVLVNSFMKDVAALKTFKQLLTLDIAYSNISSIRKDLPTYLPRLTNFNVEGNNIECSTIKQIFIWFAIKETNTCMFLISEEHPSRDQSTEMTTVKADILIVATEILPKVEFNFTTPYHNFSIHENKTEPKEYLYYENKTEFFNILIEPDLMSNELWFKNGSPGIVDAYSSETPTSHPGLFILLLLPIALVSTCLFLNYSRIKRNTNIPIHTEMDIEISNISSELW